MAGIYGKAVRNMRIMLVNHFPLDGSGSGTYTKNIAVHLAMRGHQVCVVFPENEAPQEIPGAVFHPQQLIAPPGAVFIFIRVSVSVCEIFLNYQRMLSK